MNEIPGSLNFQGIDYYPSQDDPLTFFYLPSNPAPERDPTGRPTLTLWLSDQGAILQLGVQWGVESEQLEALRQHVADQLEPAPAMIRLSPAPISVKGVVLALGDGSGNFTDLQTAGSAGFPPFTALFHLTLDAAQKSQAVAALNGRADLLRLTYQGVLASKVSSSTTIAGDIKYDLASLGSNPSLADCRARVELAIAAGRLLLQRSHPETASAETRAAVDNLAMEKAAALLIEMAQPASFTPDRSHLEVTAQQTETLSNPIERSTDVSDWFPGGDGSDHIRFVGTTIPAGPSGPTSTGPVTVKLGFEPGYAPLAFVQVKQSSSPAIIRSPNFQPATLPAGGEGPLLIETHYTDGGAPFKQELASPSPEGWVLGPSNLGLAHIEVDGTARREAGAQQVRLHVLYQPSGQGSEDDQIIYFKDETWLANWYVVTRSEDLAGVLEYDWRETEADGSVVRHPAVTTGTTQLKL